MLQPPVTPVTLREIIKGDGSEFSDIEKMEVMGRSRAIRADALRLILQIENQITEAKRKAKKMARDGGSITEWEIKRLNILRAIARDFRPLKQMLEKGEQK